jgi:hypothetical protein
MLTNLSPNKAGLALAALMAGWHLAWSLLVAAGWAQAVIDFVLWMHFIKPVYAIDAFNATTAAVLVIVTAVIGYILGGLFGAVWNWLHRA